MIITKNIPLIISFFGMSLLLLTCAGKNDVKSNNETECYVHLFDGKNFKDDNIIVNGPGEFPNLENLPGTTKDWDDEADSFKSGKNTTVIFWTEKNFRGDSVVYKNGANSRNIYEPRSMKIICNK